jgi:hypothetical protein
VIGQHPHAPTAAAHSSFTNHLKEQTMSFNFDNFISAMAKMLPAVGEAVIALHPNNATEALKIQVGTQLIQVIAGSLHQSAAKSADTAGSGDAQA